MTTISIVGRGGKTTIKTMLQAILNNVEICEGVAGAECDVITLAGLARPLRKETKYFSNASMVIANADAKYRIRMPSVNTVVDYGLSNKATVTASSLIQEDHGQTFTCCVQRNIRTLTGSLIQPKEFSVKINMPGKYNIYNALASITVLMVFDIKDDIIKKNLSKLEFNGNMEKIFDGDFSVIYNRISNPYQLFSVLESLSENEYNNIYIMIDNFDDFEPGIRKKIADVLYEWLPVYNYKIYLENEGFNPSYLGIQLRNRNVGYKADNKYNIIKDILHTAGKGDKIILLGNESIKNAWVDNLYIMKD